MKRRDLRHLHGTEIYVVRACSSDDAADLLAVGGEQSVEILRITDTFCQSLAMFHIGSRISALAWSSRTISPSSTDDWVIELAAAGADFGLHLMTKSSSTDEHVFPFGGGLSGHHAKVNGMTFCGGRGEDSARYVATVSDDKMLMVWDLYPDFDMRSTRLTDMTGSPSPTPRPQPTAYAIGFPHPLTSVNSHPSTSKEFLVSDCHGSIFLTDWRSDHEVKDRDSWRHSSVVELVEPHALSDASIGLSVPWSGSVAWRKDTINLIGAVYGSKFSIWDMSKLQGGKPSLIGQSFPEGGHCFRWSYSYPEYFAVSTQSPIKGAVIHVHNINYVHAQPTVFSVGSPPHHIKDFDFLGTPGVPRLAVATGQTVVIFSIGLDS